MVEMKDLLAEMEILDQRWSALADLQGVLVVGYGRPLCRGQDFGIALGGLVKFASVSSHELLIMDGRGITRRLSSALGHCGSFRRIAPSSATLNAIAMIVFRRAAGRPN